MCTFGIIFNYLIYLYFLNIEYLIIAQGLVLAIHDLLPTVEHRFCM